LQERLRIIASLDGCATDWGNLALLCRYQHHNFLSRGWDCAINPDGAPECRPPWHVDRERRPLINNRIRSQLAATAHRRQ
jgi:hypothetical protein